MERTRVEKVNRLTLDLKIGGRTCSVRPLAIRAHLEWLRIKAAWQLRLTGALDIDLEKDGKEAFAEAFSIHVTGALEAKTELVEAFIRGQKDPDGERMLGLLESSSAEEVGEAFAAIDGWADPTNPLLAPVLAAELKAFASVISRRLAENQEPSTTVTAGESCITPSDPSGQE
jgi:hypothetical protein